MSGGISLQDFIDASELDLEPPADLREEINTTLADLNQDLYGGGGGGDASLSVSIGAPSSPATGETVTFTASASNPDGSVTYDWQVDGTAAGSGPSLETTFSSSGDHTVTVTATDGAGATATATVTVSVSAPATDPADRFSVDTFDVGTPQGANSFEDALVAVISDADGDDDITKVTVTARELDSSATFSGTTEMSGGQATVEAATVDEDGDFDVPDEPYVATVEATDADGGPVELETQVAGATAIDTAGELGSISNPTNSTYPLDGTYVLLEDLDASSIGGPPRGGGSGGTTTGGLTPIGTDAEPFDGEFYGNGKTIDGLFVGRSETEGVGLFGYSDGEIRNFTLSNAEVTGKDKVGAVVGENGGDVRNVSVSGSVTAVASESGNGNLAERGVAGGIVGENDGVVSGCDADVTVEGFRPVGGLVGTNSAGEVGGSTATGDVTGVNEVGGAVGANESSAYSVGEIRGCLATGEVRGETNPDTSGDDKRNIGGLVGVNVSGTVSKSAAAGAVFGNKNIGGLVGYNELDRAVDEPSRVEYCYATGDVTGESNAAQDPPDQIGGLVGLADGEVVNSYAAGTVTPTTSSDTHGLADGANVSGSYWDRRATGQTASEDGATGLTTAQMQGSNAPANMGAFSFGGRWETATNPADYPVLAAIDRQAQLDAR
ncbi:PKD domain-containing protein [Haloplanus ruber]|uniref:PKD domain-containing protein n=1 Tax=Haloplanus ruber TaxID=869892 RepID=A0ABD6CZL4_9EURY|nr:PKD domain-containing protein [Haloplanus ruber]